MNPEQVWQQFTALPPLAQREVLDFIAFLHQQYGPIRGDSEEGGQGKPALRDEPFIGLWQDRDEMSDSHTWVRHLRTREWG